MTSAHRSNYFEKKLRASGGSTKTMAVRNLALELHNKYRREHEASPLILDLNLCEQAETCANDLAHGMTPTMSERSGVGRNIYRIQNSATTWHHDGQSGTEAVREAIQSWYGYGSLYNWRVPSSSTFMAKLFSQMLWKSSKSLGVGVAAGSGADGKNLTVVVTLYAPSGNEGSNQSYMRNVTRPRVTTRQSYEPMAGSVTY